LNKIATLDFDLVTGKIGNLSESELKEIDKKVLETFNIKIEVKKEEQGQEKGEQSVNQKT